MTATEVERPWVTPPADWPSGVGALTTMRGENRGRAAAPTDLRNRGGEMLTGGRSLPAAVGPAGGRFGWNLAEHVGDDPRAVVAARQALQAQSGVRDVQWLHQVHGNRCVRATWPVRRPVPEADAAWTTEPGLGIAVLTADCVPVVVCDRAATVVGVAHGGWRGLVGGVLDALLAALPVAPEELVAWLGPAIGPDAFEVGEDVVAAMSALRGGDDLVRACCRRGRADRHWVDLFTLSELLLRRRGVGTVYSDRLCTWHDARFYSYRRDGSTGRMATLAWLRGP